MFIKGFPNKMFIKEFYSVWKNLKLMFLVNFRLHNALKASYLLQPKVADYYENQNSENGKKRGKTEKTLKQLENIGTNGFSIFAG